MTCQWMDIHLLAKESIVEFLDYDCILNMRRVNKYHQVLIERIHPWLIEFMKKREEHMSKNNSVTYLRYEVDNLTDNGKELKIYAIFKGTIFDNFIPIKSELDLFGMVYKVNGGSINTYDGTFAELINTKEEGYIYRFNFIIHNFNRFKFIFWMTGEEDLIFDSNNRKKYEINL